MEGFTNEFLFRSSANERVRKQETPYGLGVLVGCALWQATPPGFLATFEVLKGKGAGEGSVRSAASMAYPGIFINTLQFHRFSWVQCWQCACWAVIRTGLAIRMMPSPPEVW